MTRGGRRARHTKTTLFFNKNPAHAAGSTSPPCPSRLPLLPRLLRRLSPHPRPRSLSRPLSRRPRRLASVAVPRPPSRPRRLRPACSAARRLRHRRRRLLPPPNPPRPPHRARRLPFNPPSPPRRWPPAAALLLPRPLRLRHTPPPLLRLAPLRPSSGSPSPRRRASGTHALPDVLRPLPSRCRPQLPQLQDRRLRRRPHSTRPRLPPALLWSHRSAY